MITFSDGELSLSGDNPFDYWATLTSRLYSSLTSLLPQNVLMLLPLPWFHPAKSQRTCFNSSLWQPFRYLKAALMSSLSFFSRLNIAFAAIAHMTWLQSSPLSLSFSPGWIPAFHRPHSMGPRRHRAEKALDTHFMPILTCLLSQLHLADMPHSLHQQTPSIFHTRAAVKLHHPLWDLGGCILGPKYRASNHLSLLQFHPVGFMQSFQAVWISWSPNSLI